MRPAPHSENTARPRSAGRLNRLARGVSLRFLRGVFRQLGTLSEGPALKLGWLMSVFESLPRRQRQFENFARLFPKLDAGAIRALRARHLCYLARLRVHLARLRYQPVQELGTLVDLRGEAHLRAALAQGRGALILGAHAGTWWHVTSRLALQGFKVASVVNPALDPPLVEFMRTISGRTGVALAFVNQDAYGAARDTFQQNGVFYIAIDRSLRPERSFMLPLGGAHLPIDPGPAILALRQRPAVLWASCHHAPDGRSVVELSAELPVGPGTSLRTAESLTREWLRRMNSDLAQWPDQWWPVSFCSPSQPDGLPSRAADNAAAF